jgi:hypothetical protein
LKEFFLTMANLNVFNKPLHPPPIVELSINILTSSKGNIAQKCGILNKNKNIYFILPSSLSIWLHVPDRGTVMPQLVKKEKRWLNGNALE